MGFGWAPFFYFFFIRKEKKIRKKKKTKQSPGFLLLAARASRGIDSRQQAVKLDTGGGLGACHPNSLPPDPHPSCSGAWAGLFLPPRPGRSPGSRMLPSWPHPQRASFGAEAFLKTSKSVPKLHPPRKCPGDAESERLDFSFLGRR